MDPGRSLADGNRLQRAYHRWATPYYARMEPSMREQAILIDRFLYSRRGLLVWLALLAALGGSSVGLSQAGMPWWLAAGASSLVWIGLPMIALGAWLSPASYSNASLRKALPRTLGLAVLGGLSGFVVGFLARHGHLQPAVLAAKLWEGLWVLAPAIVLGSAAVLGLMWAIASLRRQALERELERVRLQQERDTATREAMQAQLRLLQGQIQPHFIFNTLAALQHWVDRGDARAGPLLRSLTNFLRSSTEALGRDEVTLGDEARLVGHYLEVMHARLGERLQWSVDIDPASGGQTLPSGLLLTLVENAIEHGIGASLSGGEVAVSARRTGDALWVHVRDSAGLWDPQAADGVGLSNSRARLRHRYGRAASLELRLDDGATLATLRLPADTQAEPQPASAAPADPAPPRDEDPPAGARPPRRGALP